MWSMNCSGEELHWKFTYNNSVSKSNTVQFAWWIGPNSNCPKLYVNISNLTCKVKHYEDNKIYVEIYFVN